jgi:DNA (cytosine-5)-methyltransferase 1
MGGSRNPTSDSRSNLFLAFAEALNRIKPNAFIAENVSGLTSIGSGVWFHKQLNVFRNELSVKYRVTHKLLNAADYGIPQFRKRVFIVGIKSSLREEFLFPEPTHCDKSQSAILGLDRYVSHGDVIKKLPANPVGEYYELEDEANNFSWYYLSRNRRKHWLEPSYTIVANSRHTPIHPASPSMELVWSDLKDGFKQAWKFTRKYDHQTFYQDFPKLKPRRLSWREAAAIQTFPKGFEPVGNLASKYKQVGNAVPPKLMEKMGLRLRDYIG